MKNPDAIPAALRDRAQWLTWDSATDRKQPYWGARKVSWSDPDSWHSFDDARQKAAERESWGVGYVCAASNDDAPMGVLSVIDIDGGATPDDKPKDWLPSLQPFLDRDAYIEWSQSHDDPGDSGLHIPVIGQPPAWWHDVAREDGDHEGIDVLANKFCVFTGDRLADGVGDELVTWGSWVDEWLAEAYEAVTGEAPPREPDSGGAFMAAEKAGTHGAQGGADGLDADAAREALAHISPNCSYEQWRNIGFALADEFPEATARQLFDEWSRGTSKYDGEAERLIEDIASRGTGGISIGTLIHHATEAGWSGTDPKTLDAAEPDEDAPDHAPDAPQPESHTDGGTAVASATDDGPGIERRSLDERIRDTIAAAENDDIQAKTARHRIARAIAEEHHFVYPEEQVRGWRSKLHVYDPDSGIYEPRGPAFVEQLLERHAGDYVTNQVRNEIVGKIERLHKTADALEAAPERLCVGNGILDLHTGTLDDFTPHEYHRTKLNVDWHPDAGEPEAIDDFLHDIVEPGDVPTLYRLIAHTLYKEYLGEKAAILIGSGSNGKSMFLSLIESFIGSYNVAHRELQDFDDDGFAANNLQGKLANLATEIGEQAIDNATTFKKLTGRDSIQARVKFEKPVKFENYASLMFATNEMPVFGQDNHAIWRRWVYVDFPHTFDADDPAAKDPEPERVLKDRLFAEAEFEALLVRCQQEIQRWYEGEPFFAGAMDADEVRDKMKKAAEPVYAFGSACLEAADDEGDFVERSVVRAAYKAFADEQDLPRVAENEFGKRLLALRDYSIESTQKRVDGHPTGVYEGIQLSSRGRQVLGVDEPDDDQQTVEDRPPAKPLVLEQAREMFEANDHEAVPKDGLAWACAGDIGKSSAEHAIEELLHQGDLYEPEGGFVRPT
jgi:P4 family phage/plasmid primase-like protien